MGRPSNYSEEFRTMRLRWASDDPTPPCDQMKGNLIISGRQVTLHVAEVTTANGRSKATAIVDTSSDPDIRPSLYRELGERRQ